VVLTAGCGEADLVLGVIPMNARRAGVIACRRGAVMRVAARNGGPAAEHAPAADRFAREIVGFLKVVGGALAAADGQTVGRQPSNTMQPTLFISHSTGLDLLWVARYPTHYCNCR
jgi:hypothetical protein